MTPKKKSAARVLQHKKASVSVHRNGLHIEVGDITASDAGLVAKALLDTMRQLVKAGYDELIVETSPLHSGALGESPDEDGVDTYTEPAQLPVKRVGFTTG